MHSFHQAYSARCRDARAVLVEEFEAGLRELLLKGGFEEVRAASWVTRATDEGAGRARSTLRLAHTLQYSNAH